MALHKITGCYPALLNHYDVGKALSVLNANVKNYFPRYDIKVIHKEVLFDFDDVGTNTFAQCLDMWTFHSLHNIRNEGSKAS